jgi:uncharacterized membrane protein
MTSRLNVAGNTIYPMLLMFPAGLLITGAFVDAANVFGGIALLGTLGFYQVIAGLIGGVCAGVAGMIDLAATPDGSRARRLGVTYALINLGVLLLYAVVLMVRIGHPDRAAGGGLLAVEFLTLTAAGLAAGFAGQITDRVTAGLPAVPLPRAIAARLR